MADVLVGKVSGAYDGEVHVQRPDGSRVVVIVNIAPLIDDNGAIVETRARFLEGRRNEQSPGMHTQSRLEKICKKLEEKVKCRVDRIL